MSSFDVSVVTIRNDLEQLEKKNTLIRVRGGALQIESEGVAMEQRVGYQEQNKL